jgi:hypothetical protein
MRPTPPPPTALDETIPDGLVVEALADVIATPYALILEAMEADGAQDDLDELGAGAGPASPAEALANAARLSRDSVYVGVGYCLKTVRGPIYEVPALWPDANTAWYRADLDVDADNTVDRHLTSDPHAIPRGAVVYWTNSRYGHVALSAGGGLCWSTDYRRPGYVDLAPIASLASWCGGRLVGWAEDLNGVDVWPDAPDKPAKPAPRFVQANRIATVRRALVNARKNDAPAWRIKGLERWLKQLEAHPTGRK